jgi:hypothetical protein
MNELEKPPPLAARSRLLVPRRGFLEVHLGVEEPFIPARKAHPGLLVHGLHSLADQLTSAGHCVTLDTEFPDHERFYSTDPFGNRLEFLQPHAD